MIEISAQKYGLNVYTCPADLCVDNGAMIAWNGWELKNASQDVDIAQMELSGHQKIPLGNYMTDSLYKMKTRTLSSSVKKKIAEIESKIDRNEKKSFLKPQREKFRDADVDLI